MERGKGRRILGTELCCEWCWGRAVPCDGAVSVAPVAGKNHLRVPGLAVAEEAAGGTCGQLVVWVFILERSGRCGRVWKAGRYHEEALSSLVLKAAVRVTLSTWIGQRFS